jgi:hypothetical protein
MHENILFEPAPSTDKIGEIRKHKKTTNIPTQETDSYEFSSKFTEQLFSPVENKFTYIFLFLSHSSFVFIDYFREMTG